MMVEPGYLPWLFCFQLKPRNTRNTLKEFKQNMAVSARQYAAAKIKPRNTRNTRNTRKEVKQNVGLRARR